MTTEIPKEQWKKFFDDISHDLEGWETRIELFSSEVGAQILASGLPFHGLTADESNKQLVIELAVGSGTESHQTHVILEPIKVAYEGTGVGPAGVLDIEDVTGAKTLVKFIQPFPILVEYADTEITRVTSAGK